MKITRLKLHPKMKETLEGVSYELQTKLAKAGFITEVDINQGKIGLHMRSFRIDVKKIGYNAKYGQYIKCKKGYKRTDTPAWEQREEFNHIVNRIFDKYKITAKIVSGPYLIRSHETGAIKEWECVNYMGTPCAPDKDINGMGMVIAELMREKDYLREVAA